MGRVIKKLKSPVLNALLSLILWLLKAFALWVFFMILTNLGFWEWLMKILNSLYG